MKFVRRFNRFSGARKGLLQNISEAFNPVFTFLATLQILKCVTQVKLNDLFL